MDINKLKPYEFNKEFLDDLKGEDYEALKEDIKTNGIKTELHITKSNIILCGHQRWNIAKELKLKEVPTKVIDINETDEDTVKLYVIDDNLLRRHLTIEQRAPLNYEKYKILEKRQGKRTDTLSHNETKFDIYDDIAKKTGVSRATLGRDIQYGKLVEKAPELKTKKYSEVINKYEIKNDKVIRKNTRMEVNLDRLNSYDSNMFHFSGVYHEKRFGDEIICIDPNHGPDDIREYKDYYPTVTRVGNFFHSNGKEFSLRDYAKVQDFPDDFKFVGTQQEIKNQIGEAVSPKMAEYILKKYIKGKTYIEVFAGCGGFSVGAHKLGKKCVWCNDFNRYSGHSYKLNFPDTEVFIGDILDVDENKIYKEVGDVDFIMGGPPCQGFSLGGQRLGFKEDSRNQLYLEYLRFVKKFKPKQFIMENVKDIRKYKDEIIKDFNKIGYDVKTELVNGIDIGMKQKRVRFFFIGKLKS